MDRFEQLKQYKELLDNGVISADEFESLKQGILEARESIGNAPGDGLTVTVDTDADPAPGPAPDAIPNAAPNPAPNPAEGVTYINGVPQNGGTYYNDPYQNGGAYQNGPNGGAYYGGPQQQPSSGISAQATAILSYFGLLLWLIAYLVGDKQGAKFHLNQALVLHLFAFLGFIPFIGWLWGLFILVCDVMGIVYAAQGVNKEVPLLGKIRILS